MELSVSIVLFAVFLAVFMERAFYYQEYGEKTAMEMTVANMRTGLRYKVADLIMNNRVSEIPTLADENPMDWLAERPENYLGDFDSPPEGNTTGKWFYDRRNQELVYTVHNRRHFVPFIGQDFTIRYRAQRIEGPRNASGKDARPQVWVSLKQSREYTWLP
ncbi:MAG: hypothetical protein ABI648_00485 [Betaproteobacteria bacterium]